METGSTNQEKDRLIRSAVKDVSNNGGLLQDDRDMGFIGNSKEVTAKPVNTGGVAITKSDLQLEEQWLAVRDDYISHYPNIKDAGSEYEEGRFSVIIESIAKRRQRTSKEIRDEIMEWPSIK